MKTIGTLLVISFAMILACLAIMEGIHPKTAHASSLANNVTIDNFKFTPADITVAKGSTVAFVNHDDVPHTVVSSDQQIKSKPLDTDEKFEHTFTETGTYEYFCSLHPKMTGKITVK